MDEFADKTDDQLRDTMRSSLPNQHVSSSVYHRAKQELEFRAERSRQMSELTQTSKAVLNSFSRSNFGTDVTGKILTNELLEVYFTKKRMPQVYEALKQLMDNDYIETYEQKDYYRLTPFGVSYLADSQRGGVHYSNIANSNIAHNSPEAQQSISISSLPDDIQEQIQNLHQASEKKDSSAMKKAFAYIADKAVDVAIALVVGRLTP
jgi:DNA-binding PadR family transcriptional regulator